MKVEENIIRGDVSEKNDPSTETDAPVHPGGSPYLSALLIAIALMFLVVMARPRSSNPTAQAIRPTVVPTDVTTKAATASPEPTPGPLHIYIAGEVKRPDVYNLPPGSRVRDAVERAGGMTQSADPLAINLAQRLEDGQQITVPAKGQREANPNISQKAPEPSLTTTQVVAAGPVNINTATQAELETLPGIGPSKAAAIIAYRQEKGPFRRSEDLQDVPGIGPKIWEQVRDKVTV